MFNTFLKFLIGGPLLYWGRQWHPTPVLLPGKSHGRRSLLGCSPWGRQESDLNEWLHFHFSISCIGEGMATHSGVLAWRIPGTAEPGGLLSMGSPGIRHDWSDLAAAAAVALQHSVGFRHTSTWISHRYTYVPSLLKLPPFSHTSSHASRLSATDGSFPCHATNYHWLSSLHMVLYMIPCSSLNPSYPLFPSLCPQVNLNIFQKYFIKKAKFFYSSDKLHLRCDSSNK